MSGVNFLWVTLCIIIITALAPRESSASATFPLLFNPQENGVELPPLVIEYAFTDPDKNVLRVGPYRFSNDHIRFLGFTKKNASTFVLAWNWPQRVLPEGEVEVIGRSGKLWNRFSYSSRNLETWERNKENLDLPREVSKPWMKDFFKNAPAAVTLETSEVAQWQKDQPFRLCLNFSEMYEDQVYSTRLCSRGYGLSKKNQDLFLLPARSFGQPRVVINQKEMESEGSVVAPEFTQFYGETAGGTSFEFDSYVVPPKILDIVQADRGTPRVVIFGYDQLPYSKYRITREQKYSRITQAIGFEATIGDFRKFYVTEIPTTQKHTYYKSIGGGVFKQNFNYDRLPRESERPSLLESNPKATYSHDPWLEGRKSENVELTSDQFEIENDPKNPNRFWWRFAAPKKGEFNVSRLQFKSGEKTFVLSHEMYRTYATEFSLRGSLVASADGGLVGLGEASFSHWFENILGWNQSLLSTQRWGMNAKVFRGLTKFPGDLTYNFETAEIKYRLSQGLWTRDETIGLLGAYQNT